MTPYNHIAYGEALSRSLRLFGQSGEKKCFYVSPNSDTLYALSLRLSEINHPVLVAVDGSDADYADADADSLHETSQYYFMLLMPAPADDPEAIIERQRICKLNAMHIHARMRIESASYLNGLTGLIPESFTIRGVGPVGDTLFGVLMGFQVDEAKNFGMDASFWQ